MSEAAGRGAELATGMLDAGDWLIHSPGWA